MRINQLPELPEQAESVEVPCSYNGADYKAPMSANLPAQYYQSGEVINGIFYGFGYVSSSAKQISLTLLMPKPFLTDAQITITALVASLRVVDGGYVGNALSTDLTPFISSVISVGSSLQIALVQSAAFTYGSGGTSRGTITNNTPLCGNVQIMANVE